MPVHHITSATAPALGDLRAAGRGDEVVVHRPATARSDWPRIWDAVGVALVRGAVVRIEEEERTT
ncbi:hypothetical protein ACH4OV_25405 [Streptomyces diastaticus]|uniref:hypothetical protein n=1 Tax=Streptomyces diastaticus TaxID=1956 RepID=UPI003790D082